MKFKFIKEVEGKVNTYPCKDRRIKKIKTGDTIEIEGFFAEKALKNPDYELVKETKRGNKGRG